MSRLLLIAVAAVLFSAGCGESSSGSREPSKSEKMVQDAYRFCSALEGTGMTSKCEAKGWGMTVDAWIDTSGPEAIKICRGAADMRSSVQTSFDGQWKLRIYSPFSGANVLAECTLR